MPKKITAEEKKQRGDEKRRKDNARKRKSRADQTEEQRAVQHAKNKVRKQTVRADQTEEQRAVQHAKDRVRKQNASAKLTDEELSAINEERRLKYAKMSPEKKAAVNELRRLKYAGMSPEAKDALLASKCNQYAEMTSEERQVYLELARERIATRRQNFTLAQVQQEQANNAERMRDTRRRLRREPPDLSLPEGRRCNIDNLLLGHIPYYDIGAMDQECHYCHALGWRDENRGTLTKKHFGILCCNKGQVELDELPLLPDSLKELYSSQSPEAKYFRTHIRYFNSGMALASMTFKNKEKGNVTVTEGMPGAFKVCGQLQRRIGSMLQQENSEHPTCMQTYFHDPAYQADYRARRDASPELSQSIFQRRVSIFRKLHHILINDCKNSYLEFFLSVNEYIKKEKLNPEDIQLELHATERPSNGMHPGRFHLPNAPEVALLKDVNPPRGAHRSVICSVRQKSNEGKMLSFFQDYHRSYIPLLYVLLFPHGTDGWTLNMTFMSGEKRRKLTLPMWVRYRIASRSTRYNHLHRAGRLYQQYLTDEFEREQTMDLAWFKNNQSTIRADLYQSLHDSIRSNSVENSGRVTILPATFTCSERWYHKKYRDAMALVRKKGVPTFFITYTLDVNCPEVKALLEPGQSPYDRPDILCRVFYMKLKKLLECVACKEGVLGECDAHALVVEFQKRGAPHGHLLVWIKNFHMTPSNVDNVISAEIPPPSDPLHKPVMKYMIHGPCGRNNNSKLKCAANSKDGVCDKKFPKRFNSTTIVERDGYPEYRRRAPGEGGYTGRKEGSMIEVDNRWVVPYSPYLLKMFGSHINVEFCASIVVIKYLMGYPYKGGK